MAVSPRPSGGTSSGTPRDPSWVGLGTVQNGHPNGGTVKNPRTGGWSGVNDANPLGMTPEHRNALDRMKSFLAQFGLESLAPSLLTYIQEGLSDDSIILQLQQTTEWKQRFAANEQRKAKGLSVLSPAEYLATERAYRQIMSEAGVPTGFWDQTSDFTKLLATDIAPAELQGRVKSATDFVRAADPAQLAVMKQWYTEGDLIAYALDPNRAAPLVGKAFQAASIGGIGENAGLQVGQQAAERLAEAGLDGNDAREGLGRLRSERDSLTKLAGISGERALTDDQLVAGAFLGDVSSNQKADRLKSQERARFGGSSGVSRGSLSSNSSGL